MSTNPWKTEIVFYEALEPIHVGAGGYRLGRVDNTICREPGTGLPKIPGTSLAGASRAYAALAYGKPEASGQHKKMTVEMRDKCPILFTFGTATDQTGGFAGKVAFGDAHIVFFRSPRWPVPFGSLHRRSSKAGSKWRRRRIAFPMKTRCAFQPA